jgi:hypothetical protein
MGVGLWVFVVKSMTTNVVGFILSYSYEHRESKVLGFYWWLTLKLCMIYCKFDEVLSIDNKCFIIVVSAIIVFVMDILVVLLFICPSWY